MRTAITRFCILTTLAVKDMEQAPSLTMNPSSGPSTPRLDPSPVPTAVHDKEKEGETSSLASTSTITPGTPPKDGDKVDDGEDGKANADSNDPATPRAIGQEKSARERAFEYGLDRNNFETEVHQVMGTLNSWWGGVKKQVSGEMGTVAQVPSWFELTAPSRRRLSGA